MELTPKEINRRNKIADKSRKRDLTPMIEHASASNMISCNDGERNFHSIKDMMIYNKASKAIYKWVKLGIYDFREGWVDNLPIIKNDLISKLNKDE